MATSPPAPIQTSLPNPRKRPSLGPPSATSTASQAIKRPKLHPLRQTSFATDDAAVTAYSSTTQGARSENGSVANSLISGVSSKIVPGDKRGRGRPRKGAKGPPQPLLDGEDFSRTSIGQRAEVSSLVDGKTDTAGGTKSVASGRSGGGDAADDDDEGDYNMLTDGETMDKEKKDQLERKAMAKIARLTSTFDEEREYRYQLYKRVKLKGAPLRRIVNQIVSQSVTPQPLLTVAAYSKYFVGEIIERARVVQDECAKAWEKSRALEQEEQGADNLSATKFVPNPHRGGLLPDHIREALRRYKGDGEGGGVGLGGLSLGMLGLRGAAAWRVGGGSGGRRLFR